MKLRYALAIGLLIGLCGCAALAGPLGLAAADTVGSLQTLVHNKADEVGNRAQLWAALAAGIGAIVPITARYVDHKRKAKKP